MNIKDYELNDEVIMEIGRFAILWNCFERDFFDNNCNSDKIEGIYNDLSISKTAQEKLEKALNERRSYARQLISDYVDGGLHPGNARPSKEKYSTLMQEFMEQKGEDLRCGCLLVIYRIRNNLMHGLKHIKELNGQLELFQAMNDVLECTKRLP